MDATLRILISNWIENRVREKKKKNGSSHLNLWEWQKFSSLFLVDGRFMYEISRQASNVRSRETRVFSFYLFIYFSSSIFERIRNDHPFDRGAKFRNLLFMCNPWLQVYSRWIITVASSVLVARTLSCPNTVWCATPIATWTRHISGVRNVRLPVEV